MKALPVFARLLVLVVSVVLVRPADENIVITPSSITVGAGVPMTLNVYLPVAGLGTVQLMRDGQIIPGVTNRWTNPAKFVLTNTMADSGIYSVRFTSLEGQVRSGGTAVVRVVPPVRFRKAATLAFPSAHVNLHATGTRLFAAANDLYIYDVSNPAAPVLLGSHHSSSGQIYSVAARGNTVVVAGNGGSSAFAEVIDVADPEHPVVHASFKTDGTAYGLGLLADAAYVAGGGRTLQIWDIGQPEMPVLAGSTLENGALRMQVAPGVVYLTEPTFGLQVFDTSDPAAPQRVAVIKGAGAMMDDVKLWGGRLYVSGRRLWIFDASDRLHPRLIGNTTQLRTDLAHSSSMICRDGFVLAGNGNGFSALDVTDANDLIEAGRYPLEFYAGVHSAAMAGNHVFLAVPDKVEVVEWLAADQVPVVLRDVGRNVIVAGASARLEARATGQESLSFQWFRDGELLPGQTNAALVIPRAAPADAGAYSVRIGNSIGTVESSGTLGLAEPPPFTPQIAFSPAPMLSVKLPEGMLCRVEASGDLEDWQTIWTGTAGANEIQISLDALDAQFFRLRYGNE